MLPKVFVEKHDFLLGGLPRAHDANDFIPGFRVNHHYDSRTDGADSSEAVLFVRVLLVV
jgi:hypothetical protein